MKGFVHQYLLKNDQYPKMMNDAIDALGQHQFDAQHYEHNKRNCDCSCNPKMDKNSKETEEKLFNQTNGNSDNRICFCCSLTKCIVPKCPNKDKPKSNGSVSRQ